MSEQLPGSQRQRQYASMVLKCVKVDDLTWRVWGGRDEHVVKNMQCDCLQAKYRGICSHIIRILMGETEDIKELPEPSTGMKVNPSDHPAPKSHMTGAELADYFSPQPAPKDSDHNDD